MENMNMADMFGRMMEMQRKVAEAQEALEQKTVTTEAGGGMVKVTANGKLRITSIKVEKAVVDPDDLEILEDLVVAGVNKALDEAAQMAQEEMAKVAGLPPGMDMGDLGKMFS